MARYDQFVGDSFRFIPVDGVTIGRPVRAIDSIRLSENLVYDYASILRETIGVREALVGSQIGTVTLSDAFQLVERLYRAQAVALTDTVSLQQLELFQFAVQIVEKLGLFAQLGGGATYHMTLTQGFRLVSKLALFFGLDVAEDLGLGDADFARVLAIANITEPLGVGGLLTPQLLMAVSLADGVDIEPTQIVNMLFNPTLVEGVEFEAGYLAPDGSFTTWVMNTRTAAVTEYHDYVFNSFASVGNRYIGASEDGLFELLGDDDDGESIVARIRGGFMQFGGPQLSRLKEAYIAVSGQGEFVLQIRTADDVVYNYRVSARDGRSTKFHMGKGQRSRYFAFELTSTGQDFELDTLEFVPLVVQRRV